MDVMGTEDESDNRTRHNSDSGALHGCAPDDGPSLAVRLAGEWLLAFGPNTRQAYQRDLTALFRFADDLSVEPLELSLPQMTLYAGHLAAAQGLAPKTVTRRLSTASSFFTYARLRGVVASNPLEGVARPRLHAGTPAVVLELADARELLSAADRDSPRAAVLVRLLLLSALRISEICNADIDGLGRDRGHDVLLVVRKGGTSELIPLAASTMEAISIYVAHRRDGPLLLSRSGKRLDRSNAARLLSRVGRACLDADKQKALHPHQCRHLAITSALDLGASIRDVRSLAGHRSIGTTMLYDDRRDALERNPTHLLGRALDPAGSEVLDVAKTVETEHGTTREHPQEAHGA